MSCDAAFFQAGLNRSGPLRTSLGDGKIIFLHSPKQGKTGWKSYSQSEWLTHSCTVVFDVKDLMCTVDKTRTYATWQPPSSGLFSVEHSSCLLHSSSLWSHWCNTVGPQAHFLDWQTLILPAPPSRWYCRRLYCLEASTRNSCYQE
jgi:hypothetical protein